MRLLAERKQQWFFQNPVTNSSFELSGADTDFFRRALEKFHANTRWGTFENFAFSPRVRIRNYARAADVSVTAWVEVALNESLRRKAPLAFRW